MNRGAARQEIFQVDADYETFLSLISDVRRMWRAEIHAYSLMPNHYHLLIHTPDGQLSRSMRHLGGVYGQRYNRRHRKDGPLFRARFKAILMDADDYLLELVRKRQSDRGFAKRLDRLVRQIDGPMEPVIHC